MRDVIHKRLSVFLAFTVLFSTLSFSVDKHVCMGEVTNTSYFSDADSCGMIMELEDCTLENLTYDKVQKEKCCDDIHELIPGNQTEQQALQGFEFDELQFVLAFSYTYRNLYEDKTDKTHFISHSPPPLVGKDINVLYQTFLI